MNIHQRLGDALRRLEATLKAADLWQVERPNAEAFDSQQPFCVDTMTMPQWLRFVFIARLDALVAARDALPSACQVAPAMDVYLRQEKIKPSNLLLVVKAIEEVDRVITDG